MTKQLARQRAAASTMADELATLARKIYKAEEEVQELKDAIKMGDEVAMQALGFDSRGEAKAALARWEERVNELLKEKNLLRQQQQQQSGAGTSNAAFASRSCAYPLSKVVLHACLSSYLVHVIPCYAFVLHSCNHIDQA
jgi:hypothetical protein